MIATLSGWVSDVDLTQLTVETVNDEKVMAPDRVWQLDLPEEPVVVRGDATQLHHVLASLLSNARKHTDAGTTVATGVRRAPDGSAAVTVTDNGPGIAPEFVGRVFVRFTRADAARKNPVPVTTPAVGRRPVGGTVSVASVPGRTEFVVRLPAPNPAEAAPPATRAAAPSS